MKENVGCCCGVLQTCCHRPDPKKDIIKGIFEINHSPWFSLFAVGRSVAIRIYSSDKVDQSTRKGSESDNAYLLQGKMKLPTRIIKFELKFEVDRGFGTPGAFVIENRDKHEFFLKSATLKYSIPDYGKREFRFYCGSWVYPLHKTGVKRVFFTNQLYLPSETPSGLKELRQKELQKLRGGSKGERKPWDRVYEYDYYNDLGDPDNGREYARPILGGSTDYPYPRRLKTGRPPCKNDHSAESRPASCFQTYVPPDERLSQEKQEELTNNVVDALQRFLSPKTDHSNRWYQECPDLIKKIVHFFVPRGAFSTGDFRILQSIVDFFRRNPKSPSHQDTGSSDPIDAILDIFSEKEVKEIDGWVKQKLEKLVPKEIFNKVVATSTKRNILNSQLPSIIAEEKFAWGEDNEFGRQMLAGTNPVRIRCLHSSPQNKEFSPLSGPNQLPDEVLNASGVEKAMREGKAYILEHYDYLLPFLNMINGKSVCAYATRTVLAAGSTMDTLQPIAIELRLPDPKSNIVFFPDHYLWELAKFHVAANDAAYHQLHTHAVIEPFIIATRRQLSVMHPIHRLLDPHFKDTLHINEMARGFFLNAEGILETTLFTGEFSMQLSSHLYKQWRFEDQALPKDLEKRGMAKKTGESVRDKNVSEIKEKPAEKKPEKIDKDGDLVERDESLEEIDENVVELDENPPTDKAPDEKVTFPAGVKLVLEDYPYAKDGTEIWDAIETWVRKYCKIFYKDDDAFKKDEEIKEWWSEIRDVGHGDQTEGWYDLTASEDLVKALTTIIWITSGLHAAVNFGQYAYAGWPPNRPMLLRKFIPEQNTKEWIELLDDPQKFIAEMLPEKFQMSFVIAVMDLLSRHTSDEVYLGQRPPKNEWEDDEDVNKEFKEFREKLQQIETNIMERNKRYTLMNRWGYAKIPYKLLYPDTSKTRAPSKEKSGPEKMDITGRGIPNSISI
ncbi:linoleate 9S-lipoxygenase 6-like [Durio zibethinus]|uniref:Lipoxygenase n=1 Tax=Durio zibethinus TaxID=66656 RepID=A0A6P6B305_DURZI|nr:linoleate 9S-lipoxygenase 6-like [Durio zibethinus]